MFPDRLTEFLRRCLKLGVNEALEFTQSELYQYGEEEFYILVSRIPPNNTTGNPQFHIWLSLSHKNMKICLDNILFVTEIEEKQFLQEVAYKISLFSNMCKGVYYTDCAEWLNASYLKIHNYIDYLKREDGK